MRARLFLCLAAVLNATTGAHAQGAPATDAASEPSAAPSAPAAEAPAPAAEANPPQRAKWTAEDVARVRAMLRAAQPTAATPAAPAAPPVQYRPKPRVYGDAGGAMTLGLSIDATFHTDAGYDLFGEDNVAPRFGVFAGHDLISLAPELIVGAELGFGVESEEQTGLLGGTVDTSLGTTSLFGAFTLRYVLMPVLQPQVRIAGGVSLLSMTLDTRDAFEPSFEDDAACPFVSLGAGILLRSPTRAFESHDGRFSSLSFGVLVEAGYTLATDADFTMKADSGEHDIPVTQASLGTLSMSGPYVRTSLVSRF